MAIYSLHRAPITLAPRTCKPCWRAEIPDPSCRRCGGTGEYRMRPGFAAAHARYVFRPSACSTVIARLPPMVAATREGIAGWLAAAERRERANGRVADRVMVALPAELAHRAQRIALVRAFADALSEGRVPYAFGLHDRSGDADNPHGHGIFRDRDFETGRPVVGFGKLGSTERIRELWESVANAHLAAAGFYERIDRRSYVDRGEFSRRPGRHRGPGRAA
jgi:MobA/MobL family